MRRRMGARLTALFIVLTLLPSGCLPPPLPRIVKIGLVAPFEGRYRYLGYDAIYAARLAVREINAAGGVAGRQLVLVAYDDRGDPEMARTAARNLAIDPDVAAVVGHYRPESTAAAAPIYANADLPLLAVGGWITGTELPVWHLYPSPGAFAEALLRETGGVPGVVWGGGRACGGRGRAGSGGRPRGPGRSGTGQLPAQRRLPTFIVCSRRSRQRSGCALRAPDGFSSAARSWPQQSSSPLRETLPRAPAPSRPTRCPPPSPAWRSGALPTLP